MKPYQITYKADLEELAVSENNSPPPTFNWNDNKYFKLMNNITDSVRTVTEKSQLNLHFEWKFNEQNYKITLVIDNDMYIGLFGYIGRNSVIENVIVDGYVIGYAHIR